MKPSYDVIIVGAGPAGMFAALELAEQSDLQVLILEKGHPIEKRSCPMREWGGPCRHCQPCAQLSGWGGAGAFSDGKLTLSPSVGGWLSDYVAEDELERQIAYADQVYVRFGASEQIYGLGDEVEDWQRRAALADLRLVAVPIRHLGTEHCTEIVTAMRGALDGRVDVRTRTQVDHLQVSAGQVRGVTTVEGEFIPARFVIAAPGREGASWLRCEAESLGIALSNNPVDVGVRVEVPASVMGPLTDTLYEAKLEYNSRVFDDRVRTFCVCPHGEVTPEFADGDPPVQLVNGHSYAERSTEFTNFALLVSTCFTEPFREPITYARYLARLANMIGGGVIVQRLGDLRAGRRSTPARLARSIVEPTLRSAVPGDLSFVLPYRYLADIMEMIEALDKLTPGVNSRHTLLYGVEAKFYSSRLDLTPALETVQVQHLFAVGDGAGVTRGLIQASASGVIAAREILARQDQ
ncbi:MAG: FAD-dependent oxidoreductase [Chloroflexia bacterium]|nr:FAD-dependent oxidoreductase [Chloroflexia bacterium]